MKNGGNLSARSDSRFLEFFSLQKGDQPLQYCGYTFDSVAPSGERLVVRLTRARGVGPDKRNRGRDGRPDDNPLDNGVTAQVLALHVVLLEEPDLDRLAECRNGDANDENGGERPSRDPFSVYFQRIVYGATHQCTVGKSRSLAEARMTKAQAPRIPKMQAKISSHLSRRRRAPGIRRR